jgi:putative ABC transport system ATP-binding protein
MEIMQQLKAAGKTIVIASHDPLVFEHPAIDRTVTVKDGRIHVP